MTCEISGELEEHEFNLLALMDKQQILNSIVFHQPSTQYYKVMPKNLAKDFFRYIPTSYVYAEKHKTDAKKIKRRLK